jgi:hypothetical protein
MPTAMAIPLPKQMLDPTFDIAYPWRAGNVNGGAAPGTIGISIAAPLRR